MAVAKLNHNQAAAAAARDLKQKVLSCIHKLSDRDTHAAAALELENIAKSLSADTLPSFISSITATDASDKSAVRKQCLKLVSLLAIYHGNFLAPYLSKILSAILRRLRDLDTGIRSGCVSAASAVASHVTKPPFSSISKPFLEALFTEQDLNSQIGTAMCLSAVIEAAAEPDLLLLRKAMLRFEKLVKFQGFKAKAAVLALIGSVIEVGAVAGGKPVVDNLVPLLVESLSSEDWAMRKAAAEALTKLAAVETNTLPTFKASCLKTFEDKKFDKVKAVRETMNQMVEVWKEIPDPSDEASPFSKEQSSCIENPSDACNALETRPPFSSSSSVPHTKKQPLTGKSSLCDSSSTTARKTSPLNCTEKRNSPPMFRKLERKKSSNLKVDNSTPDGYGTTINQKGTIEKALGEREDKIRLRKSEEKLSIISITGSRVAPFDDEKLEPSVLVSNAKVETSSNCKESEDLCLIRKQLLQIENQQSKLLDLLQTFMGSSQNGIHSLETRVHGLELALEEISFDLAVTNGRMSKHHSGGGMCCRLPGADFLGSKLWRRTEGQFANAKLIAPAGTPRSVSILNRANKTANPEIPKLENRRPHFQGGHGLIVNPLAERRSHSHTVTEVASSSAQKNVTAAV